MQIEFLEYANDEVKVLADKVLNELIEQDVVPTNHKFKAYAKFQMFYNISPEYVSLRDRTEEMSLAVKGMSQKDFYTEVEYKGSELYKMGFDIVGAQFVHTYKFIFS